MNPEVRNRESQTELSAENARLQSELQAARDRLLRLEHDVRARIARDLHDGPVQQVAAVGLLITYLRRVLEQAPEKLPEAIQELDDQLAKAMDDLRTVLLQLRPPGMEEHGLYWVLRQYPPRFRASDHVEFQLDMEASLPPLPAHHDAAVFMIIQEAIMNIRKHARASRVELRVGRADGKVRFSIVDNGKGFDQAALEQRYLTRGSFGLTNMRERAKLIGAEFRITSTPAQGTTVTIDVPIPPAPRGSSA